MNLDPPVLTPSEIDSITDPVEGRYECKRAIASIFLDFLRAIEPYRLAVDRQGGGQTDIDAAFYLAQAVHREKR